MYCSHKDLVVKLGCEIIGVVILQYQEIELMSINPRTLKVGDIATYRLLPQQHPTHPAKEWHGKIVSLHIDLPGWMDAALVESIDTGYEGLCEFVLLQQIVEVA